MAQIRAIEARGILDDIAQGAKAANIDLIDAIRAAKKSILTNSFKAGRVYVSTSGSGQSHSFLIPSALTADFTPTRMAAQMQEYVEIYNDCVAAGLITDSSDVDTDAAVMAQDDRLLTVTDRRLDLTGLRFPATSQGGF